MQRLKGLDGIRGVLALVVALAHALGHFTGWKSGINPIHNTSFAVDVFFVLSGIVLFHVYSESIQNKELNFVCFFKKRVLRLYPMHLVANILIPISLFISSGVFYPDWIGNVTFANIIGDNLLLNSMNVGFDFSSNQPSWSISIELYIGTLLAFTCCKYKFAPILFAFLSIALAIFFKIHPKDINENKDILVNGGIVRCLFSMSSGVFVYSIIRKNLNIFQRHPITTGLIGIGGFWFMVATIYNINLSMTEYYFVVLITSIAVSLVGLIGFNSLKFLDSGFFSMLGRRSFSIYLLHTPILYLLLGLKTVNNTYNVAVAIAAIILTVIVSGYTSKYIENPFIKVSHKLKQSPL
ncbi:acyltransferase [Rahnella sp. BCC 1045]|uniref:acyltransferase family protein n=1 Tax=Rahnella sp. BCC 1045 TaxID=2816251 RepID=UPI001C255CB1|nr:acyltransferase [Rahnella sp. BCC 1045]MBU9821896.1 acyltransferase [Rahnella sp. BCC 1045]